MSSSAVLAHGQDVLAALSAIVVFADTLGLISVGLGLRRRGRPVERWGLAFGFMALLAAIGLSTLFRWEFDVSFYSMGVALLFPTSGMGIWLSTRSRGHAEP